ncbi:MAG: hypothetical protein ABI619_11135 [Betaproteobacteria bacterium]
MPARQSVMLHATSSIKEVINMKNIVNVLAMCVLVLGAGCKTLETAFPPSSVMPGVENQISMSADKNGNNRVNFKVKHLAPANTLVPPKSTYVVWAQNAEGRAVPLGRLWIGPTREGSFEATVPFIEFRLIVTAEDDIVPMTPSEPFVLSSELMKPAPV